MRKLMLFLLLLVVVNALFAEIQTGSTSGIDTSGEFILQGSTLPEIKLGFTRRFIFPFLQGESPLTEGNNINLALTADISPISLNGYADAVWTPIAFFQIAAGGRIGSGWNLKLGDNDVYGIGINFSDSEGKAKVSGNAFDGLLWKTYIGAALQADLAAVFPGDWNHIVFRSYHETNYKGYTQAASGESWYYENDDGENINGFNYYGNFLIGYQMPIFINLAAFLAEMDLYLYDTPNRNQWGDEKIRWTFSNIITHLTHKHKFECFRINLEMQPLLFSLRQNKLGILMRNDLALFFV